MAVRFRIAWLWSGSSGSGPFWRSRFGPACCVMAGNVTAVAVGTATAWFVLVAFGSAVADCYVLLRSGGSRCDQPRSGAAVYAWSVVSCNGPECHGWAVRAWIGVLWSVALRRFRYVSECQATFWKAAIRLGGRGHDRRVLACCGMSGCGLAVLLRSGWARHGSVGYGGRVPIRTVRLWSGLEWQSRYAMF